MPVPNAVASGSPKRRASDSTTGPRCPEEQIAVSLMLLRRILAKGRIQRVDARSPHRLTDDELIDFWADELAPQEQGDRRDR